MSDHPASSFALGYLAAGPTVELAREGALMLTRALQRPRSAGVTMDVAGILQVAQQADDYIGQLERENEALRQENSRLRANAAIFDVDWDRLKAWAKWAEAELKRRPAAD